mgnify:FL=1
MARFFPSLPSHVALGAGDHAELALLRTLEQGLSDAYSLFHSVDWSHGAGMAEQHGEIDIVVLNQQGDVLLIEVKTGSVDFLPTGLFKTYAGQTKDVTAQIGLQYRVLRNRLTAASLSVHVSHLLVLPDVRVNTETVQWPRERIIDSRDIDMVVTRISSLLPPGQPDADRSARVQAFFQNQFKVEIDVSALTGRLETASRRLASGLATWVPRLQTPAGVIRVRGTAGSGKTQLALRMLREADDRGEKTAYICFNRALADHMSRSVPVRAVAETFHEFALRVCRQAGLAIDFGRPDAFERLVSQCIEVLQDREPDLDFLVLDEMQDLQAEWVEALLSRLKARGKAILLEDPEQQLYKDRDAFEIPDAVTITSHENFRTPRALVKLVNLLRLTPTEVEALSPFEGETPDPIVYESDRRVAACTTSAVERCLRRGFGLSDIAVISMRGRERSVIQGLDRLGDWSVNRFTGRFDQGSLPIWSGGELLIESVRRFKGQAAPAVVLTECDLVEMNALERRLLFVGLTRCRVHLEWVMSAKTAHALEQVVMG